MSNSPNTTSQSAASLLSHLRELDAELAVAHGAGLDSNETYMADLAADMAFTHAAYIGAAVTEIATLRGVLNGHLEG